MCRKLIKGFYNDLSHHGLCGGKAVKKVTFPGEKAQYI